eukprot:2303955-Rhodomonas_salina.2
MHPWPTQEETGHHVPRSAMLGPDRSTVGPGRESKASLFTSTTARRSGGRARRPARRKEGREGREGPERVRWR